jgi:hypothetical protein
MYNRLRHFRALSNPLCTDILIILGGSWVGYVAPLGEMRNAYPSVCGKTLRDNLEDLSVGGKIILEWMLEKCK